MEIRYAARLGLLALFCVTALRASIGRLTSGVKAENKSGIKIWAKSQNERAWHFKHSNRK